MNEIDNGPESWGVLAKAGAVGVVKILVIKWAVVYGISKLAKRALEDKAKS